MDLMCDERPSDSPFISMAEAHNGLVITNHLDKNFLTVRGPETRATPAYSREGAEFIGITFKPGVFMPDLPARMIMDRHDVTLLRQKANPSGSRAPSGSILTMKMLKHL